MSYHQPGTTVNVLLNPNLASLNQGTRYVAVVGLGPTSQSVVDEAVVRGTGSTDYLAAYTSKVGGVSVSQIAETPNVTSGSVAGVLISQYGLLYNLASASVNASGSIGWPQSTGSITDVPSTGSIYYVRYTSNVPSTNYLPQLFYQKSDIAAAYGAENNTTGILTVAGDLVLEQGAAGVMLVQASGSSYSQTAYQSSIDLLQTKNNIEYVMAVFPSASVTRAQQETFQTYQYSHVIQMNNQNRERGMIIGSPSQYYTSDGFNTIGDNSTPGTFCYRANAFSDRNVIYVAPSKVWRSASNGTYFYLDGNFVAVAVGGAMLAQPLFSSQVTGITLAGLQTDNDVWNTNQMNQLGGSNVLVCFSTNNVFQIRDPLTTDNTNADTIEPSITQQERLVKRTLRDGITDTFIKKQAPITSGIINDVIANIRTNLQELVRQTEITAYGQKNDPSTGETIITAQQNVQNPKEIDASCSVAWVYPFKYANITVSTFVG